MTGKDEKEDKMIQEIKEILNTVVEQKTEKARNERHEVIITILLSLATLASAWCSYQANIWDDREKKLIAESKSFEDEANKSILESNQIRGAHLNFVMAFIEHFRKGDIEYCDFMLARTDSILKPAIKEWIALEPLKNPEVPSPLQLNSYKDYQLKQSQEFKSKSIQEKTESETADNNSDRYMLLTVLFALVLFFSGISGTLDNKGAQILSLIISVIVLLGAIIILIGLPVGSS